MENSSIEGTTIETGTTDKVVPSSNISPDTMTENEIKNNEKVTELLANTITNAVRIVETLPQDFKDATLTQQGFLIDKRIKEGTDYTHLAFYLDCTGEKLSEEVKDFWDFTWNYVKTCLMTTTDAILEKQAVEKTLEDVMKNYVELTDSLRIYKKFLNLKEFSAEYDEYYEKAKIELENSNEKAKEFLKEKALESKQKQKEREEKALEELNSNHKQ